MKISQAAEASGCHLETIRYYERIGLLPQPGRTGSGYRVYEPADIERLRFITAAGIWVSVWKRSAACCSCPGTTRCPAWT